MMAWDHTSGAELIFDTADRLRLARLKAGVEQEEMAEALGVSSSTISNWEHARSKPKMVMIAAWAQITGFRMADLLGPADAAKAQPTVQALAGGRDRRHRHTGTVTGGRVSWLPRMDSNHQPPDSAKAQQRTCIKPLNVTGLHDPGGVCPDSWLGNAATPPADDAGLSCTRPASATRIKPTNVNGF